MSRSLKAELLVLLGLLLIPLILFAPVTLGDKTLIPADVLFTVEPWRASAQAYQVGPPHNGLLADLLLENYAWKQFIIEQLQQRELPLWNPYAFAGMPFLATGQHSALYPFSLLFYVLPLWRAYGWFAVSQLFVAGACAYVFLRGLRLPRLAAAGGAVVYQLSLFMVVSTVFPMIVAGAAWLPLVLACIGWIVERRPALGRRPASLPWVALGAIAIGCQILAGHPEVIYYSALISAAYAAYLLVDSARKAARTHAWTTAIWAQVRPVFYLIAMALAGAGIGAVQLIPLLDIVRHNFRTGSATLQQILGWAYPSRRIIAFLIPNFFGNPSHHEYFDVFAWRWMPARVNAFGQPIEVIDWGIKNYVEGGAYVGILPLLLSAIALVTWARSHIAHKAATSEPAASAPFADARLPFFLGLALLCLAFVFGTPLYALVYALPGIGQLHSPFRWVWPLSLCVAVMSACGLATLQRARRLTAVTGGLAIGAGTAVLVALAAARLFYDRIAATMDNLVRELARAPEAFADGRMFFSYEARQVLILACVLIASGLALRLSSSRLTLPRWLGPLGGRPLWGPLALVVIVLDLLVAGYGFNPAVDPQLLEARPPAVRFLQNLAQTEGPWRVTTFDPDGRKPLNANLAWLVGLQDVRGYDSIILKSYADYMTAIEPQGELQYNRIAPISNPASLDSPLLDLLNVRYVVSLAPITSPKYTLVYDDEVKIYRNEGAAPRAFTLPLTAARHSADPLDSLRALDPRQWVVVDDPAAPHTAGELASPAALSPAEVVTYTANEVELTARVAEESYLVLADSYYPGWLAYIRPAGASPQSEEQTQILRVDGNFRGVVLSPGDWTVRFRFSPLPFKAGALVSGMTLVALVLAAGTWLWRRYAHAGTFDTTARRVAKNSMAPMAMHLLNRGIDMLFAAFMLRLLGPGEAGKYYFAIVVVGWFEILTNYGLNTFLTREVARDPAQANRYLVNTSGLRLRLAAVALPCMLVILWVARRWLGLGGDVALAIVLFALGMIPASLATGFSALFYAYEKAEVPAVLTVITSLLKVTLGGLALLAGYSYLGLAATSVLVNLITAALLAGLSARTFFVPRREHDAALQKQMLRESFPLMLNHLLATLFFKVDVTLLQPIRNHAQPGLGDREVGWYSTGYKFIDAYNIIPSFFTFGLFPVLSRQAHEDRDALRRNYSLAVKLLVATALPLAIVTAFLAETMIGLLGGAAFLPHGAVALSLMVWSIPFGWVNSLTNYVLVALDEQRRLTRAFVVALAFNVTANVLLLPRYGYVGAAIVTIASEVAMLTTFHVILRSSLGPVPWLRLCWRPALAAGAMAGALTVLWPWQPLLGLLLAAAVYVIGLRALQVFDENERAVLAKLLPSRVRRLLTGAGG